MTNDITVKSITSVAQASKNNRPAKNNDQAVIGQDSFKIIAKISSSNSLSETEKSGLINNVALVEKYAKGNLRTRMLNDITATTIFLEQHGTSHQIQRTENINKAIETFKHATKASAPVAAEPVKAQQQIAQTVASVKSLPTKFNTSVAEVKQSVSQQEIQAVFNQPIKEVAAQQNVEIKEIKQLGSGTSIEQFNVKDEITISKDAQTAQEVTLPGSSSESAVSFPVLGSGDFEEIPLPGGNNSNIEADIAARVAILEDRGIEELPLPGGINIEAVAEEILESPKQAIESIGELVLPGGTSENGSANERAAHVALSV